MKNVKAIFAIGFIAGITFALVTCLNLGQQPQHYAAQDRLPSAEELDKLRTELKQQENPQTFVKVAKLVRPSVVHIVVSTTVEMRDPWEEWFDDPFFRRFFGERRPPQRFKQQSQGTGFIIDGRSYILTNNHVVRNADQIIVRLMDHREFEAKLVGTDPVTDLAVIKVDVPNLPSVELGDSDKLEIGEWVVALGNPFGLESTVTLGIVSAKGRSELGITDVEDFIQTDAAINPGNSGGPLVNTRGQVVGVNAAIFSRSGGYQGIGFAIPINLARKIMDQLIKQGRVRRGTLGVRLAEIDPRTAKQLGVHQGAVIADVFRGSPARRAGLQKGDLVVKFDGQDVRSAQHLRSLILQQKVGSTVTLEVQRNGRKTSVQVPIEEWSPEY